MDLGTPSMKYFQPTKVEMITNRRDSNAKVFVFVKIFFRCENWLQLHVAELVFCKAVIFLWTYQLSCSAVKLQSKAAVSHLLAKSKLTERPPSIIGFSDVIRQAACGQKRYILLALQHFACIT